MILGFLVFLAGTVAMLYLSKIGWDEFNPWLYLLGVAGALASLFLAVWLAVRMWHLGVLL